MLKRHVNDRVEMPVGDDKLPTPDRSLKHTDCFKPDAELWTLAEVADFLRISVPSARRLQQGRRIPFIKVGGSVRFSKEDVRAYLAKRRVEAVE